jgi:hypothetical protein
MSEDESAMLLFMAKYAKGISLNSSLSFSVKNISVLFP